MASEHSLSARLARLLRECSLEAGGGGMLEDAKRVAEKVGIEYQNVEATCRRAEEALFGRSSAEKHGAASDESPPTPSSTPSPVAAPAGVRSVEPRRSVTFEDGDSPHGGTASPLPAAAAAAAAGSGQAGQWPALPAAQNSEALLAAQEAGHEADEDGIERKPSIKNTFLHLQDEVAREADAGPQTCPILQGARWGGKRASRSKAADAEQAPGGQRSSGSRCPEDSAKILEELRTPDLFDTTPNKFAWPYDQQGGGVFERTLREQAGETASRRSSLASRRSESQRGSLMQVEEITSMWSMEGSSPDWFQPTPTPFATGSMSLGGGVFNQQLAQELSDSPRAAAQRTQTAPPVVDASGRPPPPRAPAGPPPPVAAPQLPLVPPGYVSYYDMIFPPPGVASPTGLHPPWPPPVPYLNPPPLMPPHFEMGPPFGWPGLQGAVPPLPPFPGAVPSFPSAHVPPLMPPLAAPPGSLDYGQGWGLSVDAVAAAAKHGGGETCAPGQSTDAARNRRRRGCKKAREPDRQAEDPLSGLPVWACVDLGDLVKSATIAAGGDGAVADGGVHASAAAA